MFMLIWKNISRRRTQSRLTVTITMLTVLVFVMVLGVFQTVSRGLALSRERLGADAVLIPKYASADGGDLLLKLDVGGDKGLADENLGIFDTHMIQLLLRMDWI